MDVRAIWNALSAHEKAKQKAYNTKQAILKFKPSKIKPPFLDEIMEYINEENVVVASLIPYVACLMSFFIVFVTSVDKNAGDDELICSTASVLLQLSIIILFLIPLVYFINNQLMWQEWTKYILKSIDKGKEKEKEKKGEKLEGFFEFSAKKKWYETIKSHKKEYMFSMFIFLLVCCYVCSSSLLGCAIGTQGTNIVIFILIILGFIYFVIGQQKKSTAEDVKQLDEILTKR